jgi:HPr kinase/phosphorylase
MPNASPVTVREFYRRHQSALGLSLVAGEAGIKRVIHEPTVNRPGLLLAGFARFFARRRVQVIGSVEWHYLRALPAATREERYRRLLAPGVPCVVFCRGYHPSPAFRQAAEKAGMPVFRCPLVTMKFINQATLLLEGMFERREIVMGSMVDILGIGVLIRGESGIGKSECVLALIERGYSLVSDDATQITLHEGRELIGTSPDVTRDHMEVRGIGIINVPAMFGIRSIRTNKRVDLVVDLKDWEAVQDIERVGMEEKTVDLLGIRVPHIIIPVRSGRDLARLVEVAAFHAKLRLTGTNPAQEFEQRLINKITGANPPPADHK